MLKDKILHATMASLTIALLADPFMVSAETITTQPSHQQQKTNIERQQKKSQEQQRPKQQQAQQARTPQTTQAGAPARPQTQQIRQDSKPTAPATTSRTEQSVKSRSAGAGASPEQKKAHKDIERKLYLNRLKSAQARADSAGDTQKAKTLELQRKQYEEKWGVKASSVAKTPGTSKTAHPTSPSANMSRTGQQTASESVKLEKQKEQMSQGYRDQWSKLTNAKIQAETAGDTQKAKAIEQQRKDLETRWNTESKAYQTRIDASKTSAQNAGQTPVDASRTGQASKPAFMPGAAKPPANMYLTPEQAKEKEKSIKAEYDGTPHYIYNDGKIVDVVPQTQEKKTQSDGTEKYVVTTGYEMVTDVNTGRVYYKKTAASTPQISISPGSKPSTQTMGQGKAPYSPTLPAVPSSGKTPSKEEQYMLLRDQSKVEMGACHKLATNDATQACIEKVRAKYDPQYKALGF